MLSRLMDFHHRRQYCSRRLHRIYKGVKFLHGRGKYHKKKLEPETIKDERYLSFCALLITAHPYPYTPWALLLRAGIFTYRWSLPSVPGHMLWI